MRAKSLVTFRSKCTGFKEGKMEKVVVPDPSTVWETCTVSEEQIQSLADRGLLRPNAQVGWRPVAGEEFPTEGTGETVVFIAHIERGLGVPAGDFLRGLLHSYRIKLVHLAPNSITIISTFVHLSEAYLDIVPHFHLWRHFFKLKKTGKGVVIGSVGFMLRRNMKSEYIDLTLPDNTTGWKQRVVLPRQPRADAEGEDRAGPDHGPGMDQLAGNAGHQGAQALAGRPGAAQGGGADRRCGGHQLLPPPHLASSELGSSGL
jgi:hypothetical protein